MCCPTPFPSFLFFLLYFWMRALPARIMYSVRVAAFLLPHISSTMHQGGTRRDHRMKDKYGSIKGPQIHVKSKVHKYCINLRRKDPTRTQGGGDEKAQAWAIIQICPPSWHHPLAGATWIPTPRLDL